MKPRMFECRKISDAGSPCGDWFGAEAGSVRLVSDRYGGNACFHGCSGRGTWDTFDREFTDFRYLDAPASPAWITDAGRLWEFIGKDIAVKEYQGHWTFGKLQGVEGAAYSIQNCTRYAGDVFRFCEIQLPEEPMEPQLPPVLEDIQVCSIGIPDGYVPASQLDAVRERAKRCYNALAGVDDVEAFVAAAKERG